MKSIRWKIILLCVVTILVPILFLNWYTFRTFGRFTSRELEARMVDSAFLVGEQYKGLIDADGVLAAAHQARLAAMLRTYEERIRTRIQVLGANGTVLADSSTNAVANTDLYGLPEV